MTCREIYRAALRMVCEKETDGDTSDYEDRAGYLLAAFCTEASRADNRCRMENGEGPVPPFAKLFLDLDSEFPLLDLFLPAAEYYLAAMLVMDENEEMSERYFARYTDAMSMIEEQPLAKVTSIKDRYNLL